MAGELDKDEIEYFVAIGALEFSHINANGEEIYKLTDKAEELAPEFYEEQVSDLNSTVFSLWNKGIIDVVFDDDGSPLISLNEDTSNLLRTIDLDDHEQDVMAEIILSWYLKEL
jgi:hypothetical protein